MYKQPNSYTKVIIRLCLAFCFTIGAHLSAETKEIFLQGKDGSIHSISKEAAQHSNTIMRMYTGEFKEKDEGGGTEAKPLRLENLNEEELKYICIYLTRLEEIYSKRKEETSQEKTQATIDELFQSLADDLLHRIITKKQCIDLVRTADYLVVSELIEAGTKLLGKIINWATYEKYKLEGTSEELQNKIASYALALNGLMYYPLILEPTRILRGHSAPIRDIAVSEENPFIFSTSTDNTLKIWNYETGKLHHTFYGVQKLLGVCNAGRFLVTEKGNFIIAFWDLETGANISEMSVKPFISNAIMSTDGTKFIVFSTNGTIDIYDMSPNLKAKLVHTMSSKDNSILFDGKETLISFTNHGFHDWNLTTGKQKKIGDFFNLENGIFIHLSDDSTKLIVYDFDGEILTFDLDSGEKSKKTYLKGYKTLAYINIHLTNDKTKICAEVIDLEFVKKIRKISSNLADTRRLIEALGERKDEAVKLYVEKIKTQIMDIKNGQPLLIFTESNTSPSNFSLCVNGKYAAASKKNKLVLWNLTGWWQNYINGTISLKQALFIRMLKESCDGDEITLHELSQTNEGTEKDFTEIFESFPADVQKALKAQYKLQIKQPTNKEDASTSA